MPATKTRINFTDTSEANNWGASKTLTAGAGDVNSDAINLSDSYGAIACGIITNGATGPTVAAQIQLQISDDGSDDWVNFGGPIVGKTSNNGVTQWVVEIPPSVAYLRAVAGSNTGQDVTLSDCYVTELTSL